MTTTGSERPLVGVGAVVIDDGRLLLVQRGRDPGRGLWAVPGGKVRSGEHLQGTARREVLEETGLEVDIGELAWVGEVIDDDYHIVLIDFFGRLVGGEMQAADDAADVRWVPLGEVREYPLTPTMYDLMDSLGT